MPRKTKSARRRRGDGKRGGSTDGSGDGPPQSTLREWLKSVGIAVVLFLVLRTFLIQTFVITSGSMKDTLLVGDFLMVNRAAIGSPVPFTSLRIPGYSEPRRNDVLVFDPPHEEDLKLVKRLVGMPGDTLSMRDRVLYVDGTPVDEPWVRHQEVGDQFDPMMAWQSAHLVDSVDASTYRPTRDNWGPLVVPEDHYFMLGDNRETSLDSRYWGLLESWRLEGRAVFIYFSYDRESLKPFGPITAPRLGRIGTMIR